MINWKSVIFLFVVAMQKKRHIKTCDIEHLLEAVDSSSAQAGELDLYFGGFDYAMNGKNRHQRHNYPW